MPSVPAHFESRQLADCPAYLRNLAFRYNCPAAGSCSVADRFRLAELILSAICRRRVGTVSRSHSLLWIAARHCLILVAAIGISLHWVAAIAGCTGRCRTPKNTWRRQKHHRWARRGRTLPLEAHPRTPFSR